MASRLMAKTFEVPESEKGSPLQSKVNAFTKGKNIIDVHSLTLDQSNGSTKAALLYEVSDGGEPSADDRVYAKVLSDVPVGSELQTKVNSFSKGKELGIKATAVAVQEGNATVVLLYTKPGGDGE